MIGNRLIHRGGAGYEEARVARLFHSRHPERYPAAVLHAGNEDDVILGVCEARERGWTVTVRSGGHSFPVWSLRDDALLIDLGGFKEISLDPDTGVVSITPSVQSAELNAYLGEHRLFFGSGGCPTIGLGGFLLQGGVGYGFRGWGYAAEQVVAVDVVTADGELVRADEHRNSDLFWAARGAGPGFCGVITRFHLETRPLPAGLATTTQVYPVERYADIVAWLWQIQDGISPEVQLVPVSTIPRFPIPGHGQDVAFIVWAVAFSASHDDALAALAPLAECPLIEEALLVEHGRATTIPELMEFVGLINPEGMRYRVDSAWVDGARGEVIPAMRKLVVERPKEDLGYTFFTFALPRAGPDMAMSLRTDLMIGSYVIYEHERDDEAYRRWTLDAMRPLEPFTVGQYWGDSDQLHREVKTLTDEAWARLQEIRAARDPDGVFANYLAGPAGFRNVNGWAARE